MASITPLVHTIVLYLEIRDFTGGGVGSRGIVSSDVGFSDDDQNASTFGAPLRTCVYVYSCGGSCLGQIFTNNHSY